MKQIPRLFAWTFGVVLVVSGSLVWQDRNSFPSGSQIAQRNDMEFVALDSRNPTDLTAECNTINGDGWIVLIVDLMAAADATPRRFFQTSDEPFGLFIEYDPGEAGLLRLGLGLGPEKWNTEMSIRNVRRNERITVAVGIDQRSTRMVTSVADRRINWPDAFVSQWKCDAVQMGYSDGALTSALPCHQCDVSVSYATGVNSERLESLLDSLSNEKTHHWKRTTGSLAVLAGLYLLVFSRSRRSKHELQ